MTDKSIFREIHDDDDVSDIVKKCIVALVVGAAVIILLVADWGMYKSTPVQALAVADLQHLIQKEADPVWQAEERRLRKKHRDRVIIYEPGQVPYYYCGPGKKNKCKFM